MENDSLNGKQAGSQVSRRVTRRLAWIQPVCISLMSVPALKGLSQGPVAFDIFIKLPQECSHFKRKFIQTFVKSSWKTWLMEGHKEQALIRRCALFAVSDQSLHICHT